MRSAKSLISGFGTAISLVGAITCAFIIAAAVVAVNGSFDLPDNPGPSSKAIVASVKFERAITATATARPTGPTPFSRRVPSPPPRGAATTVAPTVPGQTSTAASSPPASPVAAPPAPPPVGAPTTKPSTTAPLASATAGLAQAVATVVTNATGSLASTVAPISPALGGTLQGVGTGLAYIVVSLGNTVAGVVNALGGPATTPQG
jgi:hypothetical protein